MKDDGVLRDVELVNVESLPLSVVLVFDESGSVRGEKLLALQAAARAFLDALRPDALVTLVSFSDDIVLLVPPGSRKETARQGLEALRAGGSSAVLDALYAGLGLAGRTRSLVVLFSDAADNTSWLSADEVRHAAERSNALVHAIGFLPGAAELAGAPRPGSIPIVNDGVPHAVEVVDADRVAVQEPRHVRELRQIAETTGGRFWAAESVAHIQQTFAAVASEVNARYVLRFEPKPGSRPGWHRLEVRLKGRKGSLLARKGYYLTAPRD